MNVLDSLLSFVRPALEEHDEWEASLISSIRSSAVAPVLWVRLL